jgi:hypothetical protein
VFASRSESRESKHCVRLIAKARGIGRTGAERDAAAVCKLARESLHRRGPSPTEARIRRQKQKGDAVQSVAGSVDTVNRK